MIGLFGGAARCGERVEAQREELGIWPGVFGGCSVVGPPRRFARVAFPMKHRDDDISEREQRLVEERVDEELAHESPDGAGPPREVARVSMRAMVFAVVALGVVVALIGWAFGLAAGLIAAALAVTYIVIGLWPGIAGGMLRRKEREEAAHRVTGR